jgi:hypothetical protein
MTLIAIATYGRSAEFITDTLCYMPNAEELGRTTKYTVLAHIDTAILTQGDKRFGACVSAWLSESSAWTPDFDTLVAETPDALRDIWRHHPAVAGKSPESYWGIFGGTVFLVGYSLTAGEFKAFSFAFDRNNFEPEPLTEAHVMPAPFTVAPSDMELVRCLEDPDLAPAVVDAVRNRWANEAPLAPPRTRAQWIQLAKDCREHRALDQSRLRTLVGGDVHHTRLGRGKVSTHVIHTYNDSGAELQKLVAWSHHPQAQLAACWCESGKTWRECHLIEHLDEPCGCGQGESFGNCHAVKVEESAQGECSNVALR